MQALADLQQAVAHLRAYLGLASVASTLSSFPHGATGSPTASSPPPRAASDSRRATEDADRKLSTMEKHPRVDFPCIVTPATTDEEDYNRSPNFADRSLGSTNCDRADLAPQLLPSHADDEGADLRRMETMWAAATKIGKGRMATRTPGSEASNSSQPTLVPDRTTSSSQSGTRSSSSLATSRFPTTRMAGFPGAAPPTGTNGPALNHAERSWG
ncbi:hypothetical protein GUJ93_ZPchr0005g14304 [Zizania palustris]|uniref:Uncharacterized protein n=1 Tax=Zizania palustris TaxID=103762 RepID=A0A8J5SSL6_ZIZPA|nr:hypothetical protein GUJ93_ZPchr0005g14304 [Zizania palustris]